MKLDNPLLVRRESASEERLAKRKARGIDAQFVDAGQRHPAPNVPDLAEPFRATTRHAVFVAERRR
jgi:hypothetical protein